MTCHQSNTSLQPIGTKLRNLNRSVERKGTTLNQLTYLQEVGVLNNFDVNQMPHIVNYDDASVSLTERERAYLAMNCAHCHNPDAWKKAARQGFDFRYETPLDETGIISQKRKVARNIQNGEMPLIGTTVLDDEGIELLLEFMESL